MLSDTVFASGLKLNTPSLLADQITDDYLESPKLPSPSASEIWQKKLSVKILSPAILWVKNECASIVEIRLMTTLLTKCER